MGRVSDVHTHVVHAPRSVIHSLASATPIDDVDIRRPPRRSKSAEKVKREKSLAISRFRYFSCAIFAKVGVEQVRACSLTRKCYSRRQYGSASLAGGLLGLPPPGPCGATLGGPRLILSRTPPILTFAHFKTLRLFCSRLNASIMETFSLTSFSRLKYSFIRCACFFRAMYCLYSALQSRLL